MARRRGREATTVSRLRRRPSRVWRRVPIALTIVGLSTAALILARSSLFHVSRIDVLGAHMVSKDDVLRASGLHIGESILGLDLRAAEREVAKLPQVEAVHARRRGATHVQILIEEA